jgi:hypothetical protein
MTATYPPNFPEKKTSGLAIASLVLGIVSLMGGAILLIPPLLAVIFGHISMSSCRKDPVLGGRGMGIAGLVMGYVSFIPALLFMIGLMSAMAIPAFSKVRASAQEKMINNISRQLGAAADQYYLESGKTTARYSDLVGPDKFIKSIPIVNGEVYPTEFKQGEPIIVKLKNGQELRYSP